MKSLSNYLTETRITAPSIQISKFYRANIAMENNHGNSIGDVECLSVANYSAHKNAYSFTAHKDGRDDMWAIDVSPQHLQSETSLKSFCDLLNRTDKFFQYFVDEKSAQRVAKW